jgi:hypothetical protein
MPTPTQEKKFLQALKDLKLQATTTPMSDRRHMKELVSLAAEHSGREMTPKMTAKTRKYAREFGWV